MKHKRYFLWWDAIKSCSKFTIRILFTRSVSSAANSSPERETYRRIFYHTLWSFCTMNATRPTTLRERAFVHIPTQNPPSLRPWHFCRLGSTQRNLLKSFSYIQLFVYMYVIFLLVLSYGIIRISFYSNSLNNIGSSFNYFWIISVIFFKTSN